MESRHNTSLNNRAANSELKIVSANIRGFHTNVGELTHNVIVKNRADVVFVCETFLDNKVPSNYARVRGYSTWQRKDRSTQGGGVAFCFKDTLSVQLLDPCEPVPRDLELLMLKISDRSGKHLLCIGCYRPPWQGTALFDYLTANIDALMVANRCENIMIIGDLNQNTVREAFTSLTVVHDLHNHVTFPTHISGSSLDPVVTDLPPNTVQCSSLGFVGTSDHVAVLTKIKFERPREESYTRTLWKWEKANWGALRASLRSTNWGDVLCGDTDQQVQRFTELLHTLQARWVPHSTHQTKAADQPWFGPQCRAASDAKYRSWLAYKRHPTDRNRQRHREAAERMRHTQEWASNQWVANLKKKLRGGQVGSKRWWSLVKEQEGVSRGTTIPPLHRGDGSMAHSACDKADLLARHFTDKMRVSDPERPPPTLPNIVKDKLLRLTTREAEVKAVMLKLDEEKAVGPDNLSPRLLRQCAHELAGPLTTLFNECLRTSRWPSAWKMSRVVPVHKKDDKTSAKNYRPVSLLPVLSKVLESIVAARVTEHLEKHHLLCTRQYGFRAGRSAADLHLLLTSEWSAALDAGKTTAVVALDIEGAFDKVWHAGLLAKLRGAGVEGPLLQLFEDYLRERHLKVIIDGQESREQPVRAGVPQGSCLGPLLWNVYINDLLHLTPNVRAYADDLTLAHACSPGEEAATALHMNATLSRIASWGSKWQVKFAPHKTQMLLISRSRTTLSLTLEGEAVRPRDEVDVLGVTYDSALTFRSHIERLAREASGKLAALRRISWLLDGKGLEVLYKAQVRSSLEYSCLAWGGAASRHLSLLDRVQARAVRLIRGSGGEQEPALQTLQHRRDVAGLTVMYKVHQQCVPHLQPLQQPLRRAQVTTRAVTSVPQELLLTRCRTWHHQRQFVYKYVKLWNAILATHQDFRGLSVQQFKTLINVWLP